MTSVQQEPLCPWMHYRRIKPVSNEVQYKFKEKEKVESTPILHSLK